jgi:hypothetical protein
MFYILLFTGIVCICSLQPYNTQKKCVNCKFFIQKPSSPFHFNVEKNGNTDYGKCNLFKKPYKIYKNKNNNSNNSNNSNNTITNYIIGEECMDETDYFYCTTARSFTNMCGPEGQFYKEKDTYNKPKCVMNFRNKVRNKIRNLLKNYLYSDDEDVIMDE